ncbi:ANTAR domain-containing protein [Lentzea sp. NPDC060358]|uniref:ANTAR domain-containing protein n=1 Tax=Lentzea sp. NPDC060358 TaxID=3347103 RepID=UPI00365CD909
MGGETGWAREKAEFVGYAGDSSAGLLADQFARLTQALLAASTVQEVLDQVVQAAREVIPGADLASFTFRQDGRCHTLAHSGSSALELDELQYEFGEGPCLTAAEGRGPGYVRCDDLAHEPSWPEFGPAAAEFGYRAVLATAVLPDNRSPEPIAALNIYARDPESLPANAHELALLLASHATLALSSVEKLTRAQVQSAQLRQAIDSRDVIGQAKGILMNRHGHTADKAFDVLRRASQDLNMKLVQVAHAVVTHRSELGLAER